MKRRLKTTPKINPSTRLLMTFTATQSKEDGFGVYTKESKDN